MQNPFTTLLPRAAAALLIAGLGACASTAPQGPAGSGSSGQVSAAARGVFVDTAGERHDVGASLDAGRQVAFVFWQPWCGSCQEESPIVSRAAKAFGSQMDVIGVVSGPKDSVDEDILATAFADWNMAYPTVRDTDMRLTEALDVEGVPMIVIVNPDGGVTYRSHVPPTEW